MKMSEVKEYLEHFGVKGQKWGVRRAAKKADQQERETWLKGAKSTETANKVYQDALKTFGPSLKNINKDPMFRDMAVNKASKQQYDQVVQTVFNQHLAQSSLKNTTSPSGKRALVYQMTPDGMHMRSAEYMSVEQDALWAAPDFRLVRDNDGFIIDVVMIERTLAQSTIEINNFVANVIEHHGVKGQKWGVRTKKSTYVPPFKKGSSGKTVYKKTANRLNDQELQSRIKRIELEKKYSSLTAPQKSAGKKYASNLISKQGGAAIGAISSAVVGLAIKNALSGKAPKIDPPALKYLAKLRVP